MFLAENQKNRTLKPGFFVPHHRGPCRPMSFATSPGVVPAMAALREEMPPTAVLASARKPLEQV
jgi:hypothetical protein